MEKNRLREYKYGLANLQRNFIPSGFIYHTGLQHFFGDYKTAVFACAMLHLGNSTNWNDRRKVEWFSRSAKELEAMTGLSRHEQDKCKQKLGDYLETELRGKPATIHYRLRLEKLHADLAKAHNKPQTATDFERLTNKGLARQIFISNKQYFSSIRKIEPNMGAVVCLSALIDDLVNAISFKGKISLWYSTAERLIEKMPSLATIKRKWKLDEDDVKIILKKINQNKHELLELYAQKIGVHDTESIKRFVAHGASLIEIERFKNEEPFEFKQLRVVFNLSEFGNWLGQLVGQEIPKWEDTMNGIWQKAMARSDKFYDSEKFYLSIVKKQYTKSYEGNFIYESIKLISTENSHGGVYTQCERLMGSSKSNIEVSEGKNHIHSLYRLNEKVYVSQDIEPYFEENQQKVLRSQTGKNKIHKEYGCNAVYHYNFLEELRNDQLDRYGPIMGERLFAQYVARELYEIHDQFIFMHKLNRAMTNLSSFDHDLKNDAINQIGIDFTSEKSSESFIKDGSKTKPVELMLRNYLKTVQEEFLTAIHGENLALREKLIPQTLFSESQVTTMMKEWESDPDFLFKSYLNLDCKKFEQTPLLIHRWIKTKQLQTGLVDEGVDLQTGMANLQTGKMGDLIKNEAVKFVKNSTYPQLQKTHETPVNTMGYSVFCNTPYKTIYIINTTTTVTELEELGKTAVENNVVVVKEKIEKQLETSSIEKLAEKQVIENSDMPAQNKTIKNSPEAVKIDKKSFSIHEDKKLKNGSSNDLDWSYLKECGIGSSEGKTIYHRLKALNASVDDKQDLVDELTMAIKNGSIKTSVIGYFQALLRRFAEGLFVPEKAVLMQDIRERDSRKKELDQPVKIEKQSSCSQDKIIPDRKAQPWVEKGISITQWMKQILRADGGEMPAMA